jgi:signal transduction histidine kinase
MVSLPSVQFHCGAGEHEICLPCPAVDLVRLVSARLDGPENELPFLLLAENPSWLIYWAVDFYQQSGKPAQSLRELQLWVDQQLDIFFSRLLAHLRRPDTRSTSQIPSRKRIKKYLGSQNTLQFRKHLSHFFSEASFLPYGLAEQILESTLSPCLSRNELPSNHRSWQEPKSLKTICRVWKDGRITSGELIRLIELYQAWRLNEKNYQCRLRDEKLESLKQLAYGASHEINNPLANIATRAQTLLVDETDFERRHKLGVIYEQAMRSHEMISDLMLFGNPPPLQRESIDLLQFLRDLNARVRHQLPAGSHYPRNGQPGRNGSLPEIENKRVEFSLRIGPGLPKLDCDPTQLAVALNAIIRNAIESIQSSTGHAIALRASVAGEQVQFEITDDGNGVPESIRAHIFDPFFSGREAGRGLGFGLSKAWRIVTLHGGDLVFDPDFVSGARFIIQIPITPPSAIRPTAEHTS